MFVAGNSSACGHKEYTDDLCLLCGECLQHRQVKCEPCIKDREEYMAGPGGWHRSDLGDGWKLRPLRKSDEEIEDAAANIGRA